MYDYDVIVHDANGDAGAFSPTLNASRPTGGTEVHMVQLVDGFAKAGLNAIGLSALPNDPSNPQRAELRYQKPDPRVSLRCKALITSGVGRVPSSILPDRHVVLWNHDPQNGVLPAIAHLRWSRFVCVSRWQARRFPFGWQTTVIPPMLDDYIYELAPVDKDPKKFVCVSAWWKGTAQTLQLWEQMAPSGATLHVGSPYSHPKNAQEIVEATPGCKWMDVSAPRTVVEAMRDAAGTFRVCIAPETAGMTDAIAEILGCRTHVFCPQDLGGLPEVLGPHHFVTGDYKKFSGEFTAGLLCPPRLASEGQPLLSKGYRADVIIPKWIRLLELA